MTEKINIGKHEVIIDPDNLKFDEQTLGNYIQKESGWYDHYGSYLALAERYLALKESQYDQLYSERFTENKDEGGSDKYAEAKTKAEHDIVDLKNQLADAKYKVNRLKLHLRAWDKNHDNAQSLGHLIRKEMDKLNAEIMAKVHQVDTSEVMINHTPTQTVEVVEPDQASGFESVNVNNLF